MADQNSYLLELLKSLSQEKVEFIICGGVAAVLHGVERLTLDLDLSLSLKEDNLLKFLDIMKQANMTPRVPIPAESILDENLRKMMIEEKNALVFTFIDPNNLYRQVDVFLGDDKSYESLISETDNISIENHFNIKILSIDKLLEMKRSIQPPRDKDLRDIHALENILKERKING